VVCWGVYWEEISLFDCLGLKNRESGWIAKKQFGENRMVMKRMYLSPSPLVQRLNAQSGDRSFAFIYITNECQLNCAHCSFQSRPAQPHTRVDEKVLLRALDELKGIRDITLTGGEPTLHLGFKAILSKAAESAGIVYVMTNGISLVGKDRLRYLARRRDHNRLVKELKDALNSFPDNVHLFFPLDSFHLKTFRPFGFLIKGLSALAKEWNQVDDKPFVGFLSNEVSKDKSQELIEKFAVESSAHTGTALFAPWRKANNVKEWYLMHPLNRTPFAGGLYINYKGVYLNEAALIIDLREGIGNDLKIGKLNPNSKEKNQLEVLYKKVVCLSLPPVI
jgi:organic radical activating enzyme